MAKIKKNITIPDMIGYLILIVCITSLVVSSYTLYEIKKQTQPAQQNTQINEFLGKLTAHDELTNYENITPLDIIMVDSKNLENLRTQIKGINESFIGTYLVQYADRLVIYDFENDLILGNIQTQARQQIPNDLFTKLLQHPELKGVEGTAPQGGILDQASLQALKQQLPDVYKDAQVGDYLLRYPDRLVIYNYQQNKIVNAISLQDNKQNNS